jgi:hypothetical protein
MLGTPLWLGLACWQMLEHGAHAGELVNILLGLCGGNWWIARSAASATEAPHEVYD